MIKLFLELIVCFLQCKNLDSIFMMIANSFTKAAEFSFGLLCCFSLLGPSLFWLGFLTLQLYLGGQLKARCPFFLHYTHVAALTHKGIEGGFFCSLSGQVES